MSRKKYVVRERIHVDSTNLNDDKLLAAFQNDIHYALNTSDDTIVDLHKKHEMFLVQIKETAKHHFILDTNTDRKRKKMLIDCILKIPDPTSKAFID